MKSVYRKSATRLPLLLLISWLSLVLMSPDCSAQQGSSRVTVKRKSPKDRAEDLLEGPNADKLYKTPNLSQTTIEGVPAENVPLYRKYPPDQVVVGEVGSHVLTRDRLTQMAMSKVMMVGSDVWVTGQDQETAERAKETRLLRAEQEVLYEWAALKCFLILAEQEGLQVSDAEVDKQIALAEAEAKAKMGSEQDVQKAQTALGIAPGTLRREMREALLIDKYILTQIKKKVTEEDFRKIYNANPREYARPRRLHVWQILKKISPTMSSAEKRDIRKDLYRIRKKLLKGGLEEFQAAARKESQDETSRQSGGNLGWIVPDAELNKEMAQSVENLEVGQVSDIVESRTSFSFYFVSEIEEATGQTFDEPARQRVIDGLVFQFKRQISPQIIHNPSLKVKVCLNSSGFRLISDPPGTTRIKRVNPPKDRINPDSAASRSSETP